jgi:glycosyltransferase involved in cell wall biosynthesis
VKKIAVVIAAYNTSEYIMQCVESILNQKKINDIEIDLRIGVDGCKKTSDMLKANRIKHYFSYNNVGAYVIRNSLIKLAEAEFYSYFDSDDIAMPTMIFQCIEKIKSGHHAVMLGKYQVDQDLTMLKRQNIIDDGGAISFDQYALDKVGGFQPYRCAGDTDFMRRLNMAGIEIHQVREPFYFRRNHNKSVTRSGQTAFGGEYRKKVWAEMCEQRKKGVIKIEPEIIKLEKR